MEWVRRNVTGRQFRWLWEQKDYVEDKLGTWYQEPRYDPFHADFDRAAYMKMVELIFTEFSGTPIGEKAVAWKNVTIEIPVKEQEANDTVGTRLTAPLKKVSDTATCTKKDSKSSAILNDVSGYLLPGELMLIQGPPGAGATTLLNSLAGLIDPYAAHSGSVLYNFDDIWDDENRKLYQHTIGKVEQEDNHYASLTVRETLEFAARCGVPDYVPYAPILRQYRVELIGRLLGISHTMETPVGNASLRGVSGGERKRVTVAEILCGSQASVMFFDNISKGLDAATTLDIVKSINAFAKTFRITIFCSLQQLGNEAFSEFDRLCLLDSSKCLYYGRTDEVEGYLKGLGFKRPPQRSMADFLLSVSDPNMIDQVVDPEFQGTLPKNLDQFVELYQESKQYADVVQKLEEGVTGSSPQLSQAEPHIKAVLKRDCLQDKLTQTGILLKRSTRLSWSRSALIVKFGTQVITALIVGTLFFRLPLDVNGAYTRGGVLFMSAVTYTLGAVSGVAQRFAERPIYLKQREARLYDAGPSQLAAVLDVFMLNVLVILLFSVILYMMVGLNLNDNGIHFAYFYFMLLSFATMNDLLGRVAAVLSTNADAAVTLTNLAIIACIMFSGYLIPVQTTPPWFIWIYWISPVQYAFRGLAYNEYSGLVFNCTEDELQPADPTGDIGVENRVCPVSTGDAYIEAQFGYPPGVNWTGYSLLIQWAFILIFFIIVVARARAMKYPRAAKVSKTDRNEDSCMIDIDADVRHETTVSLDPAFFTWRALNYTVDIGKGEKKQLLDDVWGYAFPGRLCALMGSSGAGKTTLMDVLAMRKTKGHIDGEVKVNGAHQDKYFGRMIGYVEQMDIHITKCTVREAIDFSGKLRLGDTHSKESIQRSVDETLDLLELRDIQDTIIGELGAPLAISAEQRKRLTIAVELVAKPSILFLDEPTSGLDSRAALKVTRALKRVADTECAVLCTIHQPSKEVFTAFDSLLLLQRGGRTVYFGDLGEGARIMTSYFERNGALPIGPTENPADYMLNQIGAGVSKSADETPKDWHEIWQHAQEFKEVQDKLQEDGAGRPHLVPDSVKPIEFNRRFATSRVHQIWENARRTVTVFWRSPEYNYTRAVSTIFQALFLGLAFFQLPRNQEGTTVFVAATFVAALPSTIGISGSLTNVLGNRVAFYRETSAGFYARATYYLPMLLADLPFTVIPTILFVTIYFFLVGYDASSYIFYLLASCAFAVWANATGTMLGAISPSVEIGLVLVPLLNSILNLTAGFLITRPSIPPWYIWVYWVNPTAYLLAGQLKNVLTGMEFTCDEDEFGFFPRPDDFDSCTEIPGGTYEDAGTSNGQALCKFCPITSGDQILESFGVPDYDKWVAFAALIGFIFLSRFIGLYGFTRLRFLSR